MNAYQTALTQLDELIAQLRAQQSAVCTIAEQEDLTLLRLTQLRDTLQTNDTQAFERIHRYYQQHKHYD
ncbi:MAG: branched-chain amino acid ABC transporter [Neisseria sp.]|nr:branched-chain amino acid ABC transporter [Neisseria sp.]